MRNTVLALFGIICVPVVVVVLLVALLRTQHQGGKATYKACAQLCAPDSKVAFYGVQGVDAICACFPPEWPTP